MHHSASLLQRMAAVGCVVLGLVTGRRASPLKTSSKASPPVLVTSIGQSLDGFQVQLAVRRAGIAFQYDPRAEADKLAEVKTVFLAVGASLKGFGDAGITIKDELARTASCSTPPRAAATTSSCCT